jgi:hypothetical protein
MSVPRYKPKTDRAPTRNDPSRKLFGILALANLVAALERLTSSGAASRAAATEIPRGAYQLLPDMPPEEFEALKADIAERGIVTPIDVDETGAILDGYHRFRAWTELKNSEPPPVTVRVGLSEIEKQSFALHQNVLRRHLTRANLLKRKLWAP